MTILAKYSNPVEADLARSILIQNGIESWLEDENIVNQMWCIGNAVGGIKLVVNDNDKDRAFAVIKEIQSLKNIIYNMPEIIEHDKIGKISLIFSLFGVIAFPPIVNILSIVYKAYHYKDISKMTRVGVRWLWFSIVIDILIIVIVAAIIMINKIPLRNLITFL